jgi:hypothetical protein
MSASVNIVKPATGRGEAWMVAGIIAVIIAASGLAIAGRQRDDSNPPLFGWQVSSFHDLKGTDQAVYTALSAAAEELWFIHDDILTFGTEEDKKDPWPTMQVLSDEFLLPPFAKDASWSQQGETQWTRVSSYSFEGSTVYFGSGGKIAGQSAYLLNLNHAHKGASYVNGATIWIHPNVNVPTPDKVTRDSLIANGWKEVVPYSGTTEVQRLKGN